MDRFVFLQQCLAMKEDNGKIVAATENGIFYYNISTVLNNFLMMR